MSLLASAPTFNGVPLHPLLVHFAVVFIVLAVVLSITAVVWPAARRRLGFLVPLVALVATVLTPITTNAGEALADTKKHINPVLAHHIDLGHEMIWWIAPLFVATLAFWAVHDFRSGEEDELHGGRRIAGWVLSVVIVVLAVGSAIWVYRIGDTGAQSVWLY